MTAHLSIHRWDFFSNTGESGWSALGDWTGRRSGFPSTTALNLWSGWAGSETQAGRNCTAPTGSRNRSLFFLRADSFPLTRFPQIFECYFTVRERSFPHTNLDYWRNNWSKSMAMWRLFNKSESLRTKCLSLSIISKMANNIFSFFRCSWFFNATEFLEGFFGGFQFFTGIYQNDRICKRKFTERAARLFVIRNRAGGIRFAGNQGQLSLSQSALWLNQSVCTMITVTRGNLCQATAKRWKSHKYMDLRHFPYRETHTFLSFFEFLGIIPAHENNTFWLNIMWNEI